MLTPYQSLKEKIQAAVPEIMELTFDCFFRWNYDVWKICCNKCAGAKLYAFSCSGDAHYWPPELGAGPHHDKKYKMFSEEELQDIEILGRKIRLSDVLVTIKKSRRISYQKWKDAVDYLVIRSQYKMDDDNLDNQSQATKDFLISLLV